MSFKERYGVYVVLILFLVLCFSNNLFETTWLECLYNLLEGYDYAKPVDGNFIEIINISFPWLAINMLIITLSTIDLCLNINNAQLLLRNKRRKLWYIKCIFKNIKYILKLYLILYFIILIICMIFFNGNIIECLGIDNIRRKLTSIIIIPVLTTISINICILTISIFSNIISGYTFNLLAIIVTVFTGKEYCYLIYNFTMLKRNVQFTNVQSRVCILILIIFDVIAVLIGSYGFYRKDIYNRSLTL